MKDKQIAEYIFEQLRTNVLSSLSGILNEFNKGEIGTLGLLAFEKNGFTAGELSEKLGVSTARTASILNSLEAKKYIKRNTDQYDKRKTLVQITKQGRLLANKTKDDIINKITYIIKELGEEDINEYIRLSKRIKEILNKQ